MASKSIGKIGAKSPGVKKFMSARDLLPAAPRGNTQTIKIERLRKDLDQLNKMVLYDEEYGKETEHLPHYILFVQHNLVRFF